MHSNIVGGSTAARAIACPASIPLSAAAPRTQGSTYTDQGTMLHLVCEKVLKEGNPPDHYLGFEYVGDSGTVVLTEELIETKIKPAMAALDELVDEIDPDFLFEETRVTFSDPRLAGAFGTVDIVLEAAESMAIVDFKFGDGVQVDPENNAQLLFYAAAAAQTPEFMEGFARAKRVTLAVIQPSIRGGEVLRTWVTTPKVVNDFKDVLVKAVARASLPNPTAVPGDHCRWCPAASTCKASFEATAKALRMNLSDATQLAAAMALTDQVEAWAKSVRDMVHQQLDQGVKIEGYKLVPKRGRRVWNDQVAAKAALEFLGVPAVTESLISPAQAEKACKEAKISKAEYETIAELSSMVSSGTVVAPDSDKRNETLPMGALRNALSRLLTSN